ncbi:MAG: hypothetical protein HY674_12625 [Chloroflexi bacterium]|nr:hypothetical protein [Chloroflexota bacterium]
MKTALLIFLDRLVPRSPTALCSLLILVGFGLAAGWTARADARAALAANWTTTLPDAASTNAAAIDNFTLTSAVPLWAVAAANPANYDLRDAGANRLFGDADDVVYALTPAFDGTAAVAFRITGGPLQPGRLRFSTKAGLLDQNSNPLPVFTREFTIANPVLGQIENTDNNVLEGATPLVLTETPAGSGFSTVLAFGSFSAGTDHDYWRIHGEAGDRLALLLETDDRDNWPYVAILNASGGTMTGSWHYYSSAGINDYVLPASGTFYLQAYSSWGRLARYQMRVDISRGPQFESEVNDAPASAYALSFAIAAGNYQARVAGALTRSDTAGDYFRIPTLNVGNTIRVLLALPSCSTLNQSNVVISVEREGSSEALTASNSGALNYVVAADGVHFVRITADANLGLRALYLADIQVTDGQPPLITASSWPEEGTTSTGLWQVFT